MYLLPIEIYLSLLLLIPLGVCFAKWRFSISWKLATAVCAALSWMYFNLWMMRLDPPENGFAGLVYLVTGWFWLLPIFVVFATIFRFRENRLSAPRKGSDCRLWIQGLRRYFGRSNYLEPIGRHERRSGGSRSTS